MCCVVLIMCVRARVCVFFFIFLLITSFVDVAVWILFFLTSVCAIMLTRFREKSIESIENLFSGSENCQRSFLFCIRGKQQWKEIFFLNIINFTRICRFCTRTHAYTHRSIAAREERRATKKRVNRANNEYIRKYAFGMAIVWHQSRISVRSVSLCFTLLMVKNNETAQSSLQKRHRPIAMDRCFYYAKETTTPTHFGWPTFSVQSFWMCACIFISMRINCDI